MLLMKDNILLHILFQDNLSVRDLIFYFRCTFIGWVFWGHRWGKPNIWAGLCLPLEGALEDEGRVGSWRSVSFPNQVSSPLSSNRTCGSPAYGFPRILHLNQIFSLNFAYYIVHVFCIVFRAPLISSLFSFVYSFL